MKKYDESKVNMMECFLYSVLNNFSYSVMSSRSLITLLKVLIATMKFEQHFGRQVSTEYKLYMMSLFLAYFVKLPPSNTIVELNFSEFFKF